VTGNGGGIQQNTTVTLTVTAQQQPNYTISASPASLSVQQGNQGTSTITTTVSGGFNSAITLSASGAPSGTTVSFNPNPIPAPGSGSSTMTIAVGASTATGTYPITVAGNGGGIQQNTIVSLTVTSSGGGGGAGNSIVVYSTSGSSQSNRVVSIGRFFKDGDIPQFAQAVVGGTPLLTQCDVKNRWSDGSLKFGVVSFIVPSVATTGTQVTFQNQSTGNNTGYLTQAGMLNSAYDFDATIAVTGTVNTTVSARNMLNSGCGGSGCFRYWMQGPIVTAVIIEDRSNRTYDFNTDGGSGNPLHPIFEAWFYPSGNGGSGCASGGGCVNVGITLENSWASHAAANSARDQAIGSLTLRTGSASPVVQCSATVPSGAPQCPSFTQYGFTRWRRAYWVDGAPAAISINYGWSYLSTTGAYANFDPQYVTPLAIATEYAAYTNDTTGANAGRLSIPGADGNGIVSYDQGVNGAGYSDWIGLYPHWDIDLLESGDPRMVQMSTDNADLAGRFPVFFREADNSAGTGGFFDCTSITSPTGGNCSAGSVGTQGHLVSVNARPSCEINVGNWFTNCNGGGNDSIIYTPPSDGSQWYSEPGDASHIWDLAFIPYSLFGVYYYLEEEQMLAGWVAGQGIGEYNSSATYGKQGHYALQYQATRGTAWAIRTEAYAAVISPDGTPEQAYFKSKVLDEIAALEGEHSGTDGNGYAGMTLDVNNPPDCTPSGCFPFTWAAGPFQFTQTPDLSCAVNDPNCLTFFSAGRCEDGTETCYVADGNAANNYVNSTTILAAESGFMDSYLDMALGQVNQLGVANTTQMLAWDARRYINILQNPASNPHLIEMYVVPVLLTGGSSNCANLPLIPGCPWVQSWSEYSNGYAATILGATWSAGTATISYNTTNASYYQVGQQTTISGVSPNGFNGTFTITAVNPGSPSTLIYALASNPGSYASGGFVSWPPPAWDPSGNYGSQASAALSYMTDITTVEGYSGLNAWNYFVGNDLYLANTKGPQPQWSILPLN